MNVDEINDQRKIKEFKGITFSKFKKSEAKKQLIKSIKSNKVEEACYWSAEYICSGHFLELWEIIFLIVGKHIHLGNPKLPTYIELRLNLFKDILNNGYIDNELKMRNNIKIRKLFAEVICVLCYSRKKNSFEVPKIEKCEYNVINISHRLNADNVHYARKIFRKGDPQELFLAINELSWSLERKNVNMNNAVYWIEWILGFESLSKKEKKITYKCENRNISVSPPNQNDIIWMVWDVILGEAHKRGKGIKSIIESLLNIFCLKYSQGIKRKRKFLIYFSLSLLCDHVNNNIKIANNIEATQKIMSKINTIYKQIKKNEVKPQTDYLFNNSLNAGNLEKTISKLDKLNNFNNLIIRNN